MRSRDEAGRPAPPNPLGSQGLASGLLGFTKQVQHHGAAVGDAAVLEKVDTLPGPQGQAPLVEGDGKLRLGEGGADVGGHVVGTLDGVAVPGGVFGHEAGKEVVQVADHVGIGVLLHDEGGGSVLHPDGEQPGAERVLAHPGNHPGGDFVQTAAPRGDLEIASELLHLFHGNALGEVAGLVHVAAAPHGDVVGQ